MYYVFSNQRRDKENTHTHTHTQKKRNENKNERSKYAILREIIPSVINKRPYEKNSQ